MAEVLGFLVPAAVTAGIAGFALYKVGALHEIALGGSEVPKGTDRHGDQS